MLFAFTPAGVPWTANYESLLEEHIVVEIPENTALWRLSLNPTTHEVSIKYPGLTDAEADIKQTEEIAMKVEADRLASLPPITTGEFLALFTEDELVSIYDSTVTKVKIWLSKTLASISINLTLDTTKAGLDTLVTSSLISAVRKAEILAKKPVV